VKQRKGENSKKTLRPRAHALLTRKGRGFPFFEMGEKREGGFMARVGRKRGERSF